MSRDYSLEDLTVISDDGEIITRLNGNLAIRQNVTDEQLDALKLSHQLRHKLFKMAKAVLDQPLKLKMLANVFDALETEQQKLWNFETNPNMHMFFTFPGCACPVMDNRERFGTPYKIINDNCPIHGVTK